MAAIGRAEKESANLELWAFPFLVEWNALAEYHLESRYWLKSLDDDVDELPCQMEKFEKFPIDQEIGYHRIICIPEWYPFGNSEIPSLRVLRVGGVICLQFDTHIFSLNEFKIRIVEILHAFYHPSMDGCTTAEDAFAKVKPFCCLTDKEWANYKGEEEEE